MKQLLKNIISKSYILRRTFTFLINIKYTYRGTVENHGIIKIQRFVKGDNNKILVGKNTRLNGTRFRIVGNNNTIEFADNINI